MKKILQLLFITLFSLSNYTALYAKSYHRKSKSYSYRCKSKTYSKKSRSSYRVKRYSNGKIKRSTTAKNKFMKKTGHPNGWKGHVVDHVKPLYKGGKDKPSNMQWQTIKQAKQKDKWE